MTSRALSRRTTAIATTILLALLGLVAIGWRASAHADPYPPSASCTVSTAGGSYAPGKSATLTGSGYPANSSLTLTGSNSQVAGKTIGHANTDSAGGFRTTVHMPSSWTVKKITVSAASMSCSLDHLGTDAADRHRTGGGGDARSRGNAADHGVGAAHAHRGTASTGFQTLTASLIAVVLLGGGLALLYAGRRRRS